MKDLELVVRSLQQDFASVPIRSASQYAWSSPPLNVLDCVLSLNRRYETFCRPRVQQFYENHPRMTSLSGLVGLIKSYSTPLKFSTEELAYQHASRALTILEITQYLLRSSRKFSGDSELKRLKQWARSVHPSDSKQVGVKGFGLAGFQYMRMLFGAQTVKPDVHILRFISESLGRAVSVEESLGLLEAAAKAIARPARDVDSVIWKKYAARNSKQADR